MPYKRQGSPFWWISYSTPSGGRVRESSGTADRGEAKALEAARRLETHRVKRWGEAPSYTWDQLLVRYLKATERSKKSHPRDLESARHLYPHFTGLAIADTVPENIAAYKDLRRGQHAADATIAKELTLISAAIRYARVEWGWKLDNPVAGRIPKGKRETPRWLQRKEAKQLLKAAQRIKRSPHLVDFIELGLATGMRRDEMLRLQWARVDFGARQIYLRSEDQKGKRSGSIPLNEPAIAALRRRQEFRRKWCRRSEWVFANRRGERIAAVKRSFAKAGRKAKLGRISPHTLRHTCAAWLVQAGVPLRTVAELLRHRDIRTTMQYSHLAPENAREAVAVLGGLCDQIVTEPGRKLASTGQSGHKTSH